MTTRTLSSLRACVAREGRQAACGAAPESAPGPDDDHSCTSNQCVPASAATTSGWVCAALTTWWSTSQQISTSSSERLSGMLPDDLERELRLAHGHVLELEGGSELHQGWASRGRSCSSSACILRVAPPGSFEADEPASLAVGVDE